MNDRVPESALCANQDFTNLADTPNTPEKATARAIDLIQATKFQWTGVRAPTTETEAHIEVVGRFGAPLRAFQRTGISSTEIARALRAGLLRVVPEVKGRIYDRSHLVNAARAHLYAKIGGPPLAEALDRLAVGIGNPALDFWNEVIRLSSVDRAEARGMLLMAEGGEVRYLLTFFGFGADTHAVMAAEARARRACDSNDVGE